ncbi:MAG TPA: DegT/DnrJ/EryC1/StrS family aminotransferase [bacterium]|nr:DegT/DnrJ/EryC1/StrS family aminotransferase [bacterium]
MEKKVSDFRYNTGEARVPWAAVGENINEEDIMEIIKFLIPQGDEEEDVYQDQLKKVREEIEKLIEKGRLQTKLTLGSKVSEIEEETRKFLNCKYTCFLSCATHGFEVAYKFAGLKAGDEVIAPAITFLSTINYPLSIGAKVVLADVDPRTVNIDPKDIERKITERTKMIVPVHIGGYPCDMDPIMELAEKYNLIVLEDAAHAFGASYKGKMIGTIGDFGAYSFHEVKNINACGEGGLLVTNHSCGKDFQIARFGGFDSSHPIDLWLYDVVALKGRGDYFIPGNYSVTEIQAVVLLSQLKRLNRIIERRRKAAEYLNSRFEGVPGIIPQLLDTEDIKSTYHLYLFQIDPSVLKGDIQVFKEKITQRGVTQIFHFAPLYKFTRMKQLGYNVDEMEESCPNAEEAFRHRATHLPLYPLTDDQLEYMADAVIETVEEMRK